MYSTFNVSTTVESIFDRAVIAVWTATGYEVHSCVARGVLLSPHHLVMETAAAAHKALDHDALPHCRVIAPQTVDANQYEARMDVYDAMTTVSSRTDDAAGIALMYNVQDAHNFDFVLFSWVTVVAHRLPLVVL